MSADVSSAGLGPELWLLLLRCLGWALVATVAVAAIGWLRTRRTRRTRRAAGAAGAAGAASRRDPAQAVQERAEPPARRFLRTSFGLLWIVDGLLQAQPRMPAGFMRDVQTQADAGPGWLADLVAPLARAWTRHPVAADAATVWVQVGLGLLLLLGARGLLSRVAAWTAIGWSLVVWVLGEALGGLLDSGATWSTGAPGAVLVYLLASALLLLPWSWWTSGRAQLVARRAGAVWLAVAGVLQALPAEGAWTSAGAAAPFATGAAQAQPAPFGRPISRVAAVAADHPVAVNATIVALVAAAAVALWLSGRTAVLGAVLCLCAATWWLAQDFGVLGGLATDPGTALPLGLLLAAALPAWRRTAADAAVATSPPSPASRSALRPGLRAGAVTLGLLLTLVVPAALAATLPGPADAAALAVDSEGGLHPLPHRVAPGFSLTDQAGRPVSTEALRGKLVLVTFLDPVCSSDCPLIGNQLAAADRRLGELADRVEIVAIDTNPLFTGVADVAAFTDSHGLGALPNWHFVCGPADTVQDVLAAFGIAVDVPAVGMIEHSEGIYFIGPDGREVAYLSDGAGEQLTTAYAQQIHDEIRNLL